MPLEVSFVVASICTRNVLRKTHAAECGTHPDETGPNTRLTVAESACATVVHSPGSGCGSELARGSKAAYAGRRVVAVPPAYTSQDCSGCGERVERSLSIRTHVCPSCGLILDRDENAARNIQWAGQALQGAATVVAVLN
jgi:predicted RNA-binding Zn-ribbon protein involved in translation (DUF1610 family)